MLSQRREAKYFLQLCHHKIKSESVILLFSSLAIARRPPRRAKFIMGASSSSRSAGGWSSIFIKSTQKACLMALSPRSARETLQFGGLSIKDCLAFVRFVPALSLVPSYQTLAGWDERVLITARLSKCYRNGNSSCMQIRTSSRWMRHQRFHYRRC